MNNRLPEAVLSIWIPGQGSVPQGKWCYIQDKPCFVANMTLAKWFRNFGGYAISKRILDKLPRGTKIIYKRLDLNQYYITNKTRFQSKGILVNYGGHSQWVLPLKNWIVKSGKLENEPTDKPVVDLESWGRLQQKTPRPQHDIYDLKKVWEGINV